MSISTEAVEESKQELSQVEVVRALTNDPALSDIEVTLGDRKFKIVDLPYDDYLKFLGLLAPILKAVFGAVVSMKGMTADINGFNPVSLAQYAGADLPELVCIVCKQTDPKITVAEVKRLGKTPFALAAVVLKQIERNNMISEIGDFFVQSLPILMAGKRLIPGLNDTTPQS